MLRENAALVSMCDYSLGRLLDTMDELDMWKDTMLIVNNDHGFLLGEHGWFGKNVPPWYSETAQNPLFIWDPRSGRAGERCGQLVQNIDLVPTLFEFFSLPIPADVQGRSLTGAIARDEQVREAALFGLHGGHLNCTDGRYVLMRAPVNPDEEFYNYGLMPVHLSKLFTLPELHSAELSEPFTFTKGCKLLKTRALAPAHSSMQHTMGDFLFDLETDPRQQTPLENAEIMEYMLGHTRRLLEESDAPAEVYTRYGV